MNLPFLGRGWSFPPTFVKELAGVEMLEQDADVASSLEILLGTMLGERTMLPSYGCAMDELLFETLDTRIKTLMIDMIESAILYHESRVSLENVHIDDSRELEGVLLIGITYSIRTTNSRFNFVFPYYRLEGTDINLTSKATLLPDNT